jgi:molecular chaperone DnaK
MAAIHSVGIDLGTTYSCISYLTPQGQPTTLPNGQGELSTPSVVLFDGDEVVVGSEALRNSIAMPDRVVQNAKRYMGDPHKCWVMDGKVYRPANIAALILRYLLDSAVEQLGPIRHAVITVPAQFSDPQRQDTIFAAHQAGLDKVDLINEPVAAALCYVLGSEGMWFSELAESQKILVYDLGGGTFDLSLVSYSQNAVNVIASYGDLHLGGIDWNERLESYACEQFIREVPDDPRLDRHSMQALANDVEQCKRSLSARPRASVRVVHAGRQKTYPVTQETFEELTADLVKRTEDITIQMVREQALKALGDQAKGRVSDQRPGWQRIDAVLTTGGASRMPMIRNMLKRISGTTLNTSLSPDTSISHGAAYYAGMLVSNRKFARSILAEDVAARLAAVRQRSVNARALGVLVRNKETGEREPHYLLPANTPLPCEFRQVYGTLHDDQRRVHLHIVESGTTGSSEYVELGACLIDELSEGLPEKSPIEVTISYDEQARVHVSARDPVSGKTARTEIVRKENIIVSASEADSSERPSQMAFIDVGDGAGVRASTRGARKHELQSTSAAPESAAHRQAAPHDAGKRRINPLEEAERLIPLCNTCGEPLNHRGACPACGTTGTPAGHKGRTSRDQSTGATSRKAKSSSAGSAASRPADQSRRRRRSAAPPPESEVIDFDIGDDATEELSASDQPRPSARRRRS